eukprot:1389532-Ditylum_brightwellii.AAC.1
MGDLHGDIFLLNKMSQLGNGSEDSKVLPRDIIFFCAILIAEEKDTWRDWWMKKLRLRCLFGVKQHQNGSSDCNDGKSEEEEAWETLSGWFSSELQCADVKEVINFQGSSENVVVGFLLDCHVGGDNNVYDMLVPANVVQ